MGRPHGTRGELLLVPLTDRDERFSVGAELFLARRGESEKSKVRVRSVRETAKGFLAGFEGYGSRELARELAGGDLFIPGELLAEAEPGAYYGFQLEGCSVFQADREIGSVISLEQSRANPYLVVATPEEGREFCIPFVGEVILSVDLDGDRIDILEGFLG